MDTARRAASGWLDRIDRAIELFAQYTAAALVLTEIAILLAGVIWRYVLDNPLVWVDEVAEMLFLWLVSLGAVIALRRGEHMRMTIVIRMFPQAVRAILARVSGLVVVGFVLAVLIPGYGYMLQQAAITTPALGLPGSWEIGGELAAFLLLLYFALRQLLAGANSRELLATAALGAVVGVGLWLAQPTLQDLGNANLVLFFVVLNGACILIGIPIAFAFGMTTVAYMHFTTTIPLAIVVSQMNQGMSSVELVAVPMFVILGLLLEVTGIAKALVDCLSALVGHRRGGLSYALIGAMYLVAGISGSKAADQAAIAPVLLPEMRRRGADPGELVAQLAASAAMSETIPPSLVLIIVGAVTGVSTSALFNGGLLPAGVAALALVILIFFRTRHDRPMGTQASWGETGRLFVVAVPALVLPFLIRYAVLAGIATATEVATIGTVYSLLIGIFVYRGFDWRKLLPILVDTAALSGAILLIIGAASAMAWALTQAGFAQTLGDLMTQLPGGRAGFLGFSILLFVVLGSVLEGLPAMVLFGPLLFPVAQQLGVNVVQYAIVAILAMGIGLFSPPFGVGFYQSCLIGRTSSDHALRPIVPYMLMLIAALVLVAAVPWISTGFLR
jgi:tripartite ATP-independent transporter DctM subunit